MKKHIRFISFLLVLSLISALFASCADQNAAENGTSSGEGDATVVDHAGREVTLPDKIERIAVLDIYPLPSVLAVFFDSAEKLIGIPGPSMAAAKNGLLAELYPEILNAATDYIDGTNVNIEEVITLQPDIVFYSTGNTGAADKLADMGIPTIAVSAGKWEYDAIETLDHWIELLSQIFPENDKNEKCASYSKEILDRVTERTGALTDEEKARLFFLFQYSESSITTSGKKFFGQWWADAINAVNVGESMETEQSTAVNMEQVYAWNPTHILITNYTTAQPADLFGNTVGNFDWREVAAVKDGKVDKMPLGMYRSYTCGVDTPVTLLWLAKTVYPDLFEDVDITEEAIQYYHEVFGIELTAEQAEGIFAPPSSASAY